MLDHAAICIAIYPIWWHCNRWQVADAVLTFHRNMYLSILLVL